MISFQAFSKVSSAPSNNHASRLTVVIVSLSRFEASFAYPAPYASYRFVLRRPRELHLVHRMFLTEQFSTLPAVHTPVRACQSLPTLGLRAHIIWSASLPVFSGDYLIRIQLDRFSGGLTGHWSARRRSFIVRFKDIETLEFLIEHCKRLELLCFDHLRLEPVLDFILPYFLQILMSVVEMPAQALDMVEFS